MTNDFSSQLNSLQNLMSQLQGVLQSTTTNTATPTNTSSSTNTNGTYATNTSGNAFLSNSSTNTNNTSSSTNSYATSASGNAFSSNSSTNTNNTSSSYFASSSSQPNRYDPAYYQNGFVNVEDTGTTSSNTGSSNSTSNQNSNKDVTIQQNLLAKNLYQNGDTSAQAFATCQNNAGAAQLLDPKQDKASYNQQVAGLAHTSNDDYFKNADGGIMAGLDLDNNGKIDDKEKAMFYQYADAIDEGAADKGTFNTSELKSLDQMQGKDISNETDGLISKAAFEKAKNDILNNSDAFKNFFNSQTNTLNDIEGGLQAYQSTDAYQNAGPKMATGDGSTLINASYENVGKGNTDFGTFNTALNGIGEVSLENNPNKNEAGYLSQIEGIATSRLADAGGASTVRKAGENGASQEQANMDAALDIDGDGKITKNEYGAFLQFADSLDTQEGDALSRRDGTITKDSFLKAAKMAQEDPDKIKDILGNNFNNIQKETKSSSQTELEDVTYSDSDLSGY